MCFWKLIAFIFERFYNFKITFSLLAFYCFLLIFRDILYVFLLNPTGILFFIYTVQFILRLLPLFAGKGYSCTHGYNVSHARDRTAACHHAVCFQTKCPAIIF